MPDPVKPPKSHPLTWILPGCLIALILLVCLSYVLPPLLHRGLGMAAQPIESHRERVFAGKFQDAYEDFTASFKRFHPFDTFKGGARDAAFYQGSATWRSLSIREAGITTIGGVVTGRDGRKHAVEVDLVTERGAVRINDIRDVR